MARSYTCGGRDVGPAVDDTTRVPTGRTVWKPRDHRGPVDRATVEERILYSLKELRDPNICPKSWNSTRRPSDLPGWCRDPRELPRSVGDPTVYQEGNRVRVVSVGPWCLRTRSGTQSSCYSRLVKSLDSLPYRPTKISKSSEGSPPLYTR